MLSPFSRLCLGPLWLGGALLALTLPSIAQDDRASLDTLGYLHQAATHNPDLRAYVLRYDAAQARIPQMAALPDPMLQISHFVESVQTRTGPQENVIMLSQRLPWFGRLAGRESVASAEAEDV
ncbi:MAG: TolC family protein [Candidatus Synoicihabitans palmerolidicus]|nr:TolC family protein [Candidatus Synoicihabitans palmerolidicus]